MAGASSLCFGGDRSAGDGLAGGAGDMTQDVLSKEFRSLADGPSHERMWRQVMEMLLLFAVRGGDHLRDPVALRHVVANLRLTIVQAIGGREVDSDYADDALLHWIADVIDTAILSPAGQVRLAQDLAHDLDLSGRPRWASGGSMATQEVTVTAGSLMPRFVERDLRGVFDTPLTSHPASVRQFTLGVTHRWAIAEDWARHVDLRIDATYRRQIENLRVTAVDPCQQVVVALVQPVADVDDEIVQRATLTPDLQSLLGPPPDGAVRQRVLEQLGRVVDDAQRHPERSYVVLVPEYCVPLDWREDVRAAVAPLGEQLLLAVLGTSLRCLCQPHPGEDWPTVEAESRVAEAVSHPHECRADAMVLFGADPAFVAKSIPATLNAKAGLTESVAPVTPPHLHLYTGDPVLAAVPPPEVDGHPFHQVVPSPWSVCVLVCRDAFESSLVEAVREVGAALLAVPLMSGRVTGMRQSLAGLVGDVQAIVAYANGFPSAADGPSASGALLRPVEHGETTLWPGEPADEFVGLAMWDLRTGRAPEALPDSDECT